MVRILVPLPYLFYATVGIAEPLPPVVPEPPFQCVTVIDNYDGDTINISISGDTPSVFAINIPVRIKGIDTPELKGGTKCSQKRAKEAKAFVKRWLSDAKCVSLINIERDKYFRLLADIVVQDKMTPTITYDLGKRLLKTGLAVPYDGGKKKDFWSCPSLVP